MSQQCQCESAGFCELRGCNVIRGLWKECRAGKFDMVSRMVGEISEYQSQQKPKAPEVVYPEPVGTALKSRIRDMISANEGKTCGCAIMAKQMNAWGIEGCEANRESIIDHLMNNKEMVKDAAPSFITGVASMTPDAILRLAAGWLLRMAIKDVKNGMYDAVPMVQRARA